jgi:Alr-MurF fusion protein
MRFDAFNHDSRQIIPGEMFVAVRGERRDGHDYLLDAVNRGATGLLVEATVINNLPTASLIQLEQVTTVVVEDTRLALQRYSRAVLERWRPVVVAVTGSAGKTSTKEAIATVLGSSFATFRSWQNYNDLLGIPLSLGRLEERHEYAVLELGCDHPGEIAALCKMVRPQIGVITNILPSLLQYFGSSERLGEELASLASNLPAGSKLFYNQDDSMLHRLLTSGGNGGASSPLLLPFAPSISRHIDASRWDGLQSVLPRAGGREPREITLTSHLLGKHHFATMLTAYRVGMSCGMQPEEAAQALTNVAPMPGRVYPLPGVHEARLLDDTHNAIPASVIAGLETLHALTPATAQRIAVLGDMLSLGNFEEEAHRLVGRMVAQHVDYLVTRGERAAIIAETARRAGLASERIIETSTHEDAARAARTILEQSHASRSVAGEDVILIKGSEETRMERVTEMLMAQPEHAPERLVRQTPGWKQIVVMRPDRPTWVEIDLSAIGNNTRNIKTLVGPRVRVLVSLKADAYGHGAVKVARTVLHNGASMLGVATLSEATIVREAGINAPILIFGYVPPWQMREAVRHNVRMTLYSREAAQALSRTALALGKICKVHAKVDTGMGRLGVRFEQMDEIVALVREIAMLPGLELEGLYTHFANADSADLSYAHAQLERFQRVLSALEDAGLRPAIVHAANSAAMLSLPEARFDMVRPGIAIYGLDPSPEARLPQGFRAALAFKTQVAQVKWVPAGECISYGCTYVTERPTLVGVLPVGYADGFRRAPKNWGSVLVHGRSAPLLGRICMDQCMIDITHIPQTRSGDEVVLIGRQGSAELTAEEVAERLGTINYEVVSEILARVPRVD